MNVQLPKHISKAAFVNWVQGRDGRFELAKGRVIMMVGASRTHGLIVSNLVVMLRSQLDPSRWAVIADFGLDAGPETLRYPDIVVDQAQGAGTDYSATGPALVAEVLSPSSERTDLGDKAAEYLQLPTLQAYLVFAQDNAKAWVWQRGPVGFPSAPNVISGTDQIVPIPALQLALAIGDIYTGTDVARR